MKHIFPLILFLISLQIHSQPGDIVGWKISRVKEINSLLSIDNNNHQLIWDRLEIVFNPYFDLYSRTKEPIDKADSLIIQIEHRLLKVAKNINVLNDINFLIEDTNTTIEDRGYEVVTNAHLYYKRGQYFYLNGKPKEALKDYLLALDKNPPIELKNEICISIAAYYYNLDENFNLFNLEKALEYIDIAIPKEIENSPETFEHFTDRNHHPFEREKIMLLEITGKDIRLKKYRKSLAKSHLNLYDADIRKSEEYKKSHSYTIPNTLQNGLNYLYQIAEKHYKEKEFEKSKKILVLINGYIPKHQRNYTAYDKYYYLLQDIYSKDCCIDSFLEIDNMLNISGSPIYNLRGRNLSSELLKIDDLIKKNPKNPKIYLAKAILIYKENKLNPSPEIVNLLDIVTKFGLKDYRVHYLKGLVFKQQLKYKEAIREFDNAIEIFENDPYPYRAKLEILQKIPNYDNTKIITLQEKIKLLPLPVTYNIRELIDQIDDL